MARKRNVNELLSDSNLEKVIGLLAAEKPITKKAACELLNISYNTTRLDNILREYKERLAYEKEQRQKKRYTAATPQEIDFAVSAYLEGTPVSEISKRIYRSTSFVTNILERLECPKRVLGSTYQNPELIPDSAIKESFNIGEKVWSARYNSMAEIEAEVPTQPGVYRIWLLAEEWQQKAYQPYWELASLQHLRDKGITV